MQAGERVGLSQIDPLRPTSLAVCVRGLRKVYGSRVAVVGLDLDVPDGEVFGLLGPNGAGKTTVIKMMLGLAVPSGGTVTLFGRPNSDATARARVGFLPEHFRFHEWLTAVEFLDFHARLYGIAGAERSARVSSTLARVGLAHRAASQLGTFSKGMLQRIGLAQALLNDPRLLVLDEPTSGLDPVGRAEIRDLILELRSEGVTVLLNSHILSEVERVCDRVAILDLGQLAWQGQPQHLATGRMTVVAQVSGGPPDLVDRLRQIVPDLMVDDDLWSFTAADMDVVADVAATVTTSSARLYRLEPKLASLEDLFVGLVKGRDV